MTNSIDVPWLRSGVGATPAQGGCILQVVDWIDRNEWTDQPPCVHPVLRRLAISANDSLDDEGRQRLLDLAPRLMGTASDDKRLAVQLAVFCAERVLPIFEARYGNDDRPRKAIGEAKNWLQGKPANAATAAYAAAANAANVAANAAAAADADAAYAAYAAATAAYAAAANAANVAANAAAAAYAAYAGNARTDLLLAVLDEYDRITGRGKVCDVDLSPAARAMAGVA